jgi:hypothetical protein
MDPGDRRRRGAAFLSFVFYFFVTPMLPALVGGTVECLRAPKIYVTSLKRAAFPFALGMKIWV